MRLIDADALETHEQLEPCGNGKYKYLEVVYKDDIDNAQTIDPEPKWIPVSERLPKIGKEVLLSEPNDTFLAEYHGNGNPEGVWHIDGIHHFLQDIKGCAWMPLPEPFREEGEQE